MKRKLSIIVMTSIIAVACAGCQSDNANNNSQTSLTSENSVVANESADDNNENSSVVSDSSLTDNDISKLVSDGEMTPSSKYLEYAYNIIDISNEKTAAGGLDLSNPAIYTITTKDEFTKFYNDYKTSYCLDDVDSGVTFSQATEKCDDDYFSNYDMIIIVQTYDKNDELDYDRIYIENSELKIETLKNEPSSAENTTYACSIIRVEKSMRNNAKPSLVICKPMEIIPEGESV